MANLINLIGAPGVGKSYLGQELQKRTGFFFFDRDILLDEIFGDDRESNQYRQNTGQITKAMWRLAMQNARQGVSNIIESPMAMAIQGKSASFIDYALQDSQQNNYLLSVIYCVAPETMVFSRMQERGLAKDQPKYLAWEDFFNTFIDVPGPFYEHLKLDTSQSIDRNLDKIISYLSK